MELTRKQVIEILEKADSTVYKEPKTKTAQALEYAINSLKTDETYQIMYEGEEIFTKDDMVAMLEDLSREINPIKECEQQIYGKEEWNFVGKCQDVIQQKINKLKENENGNK